MDANTRKDYLELVETLKRHNQLYYNEAAPEIADREYDALLERLLELEQEYPELVTPDSPSQKVGAEVAAGAGGLVRHNPKMMSISNCYDEAGIQKFVKRCESLAGSELAYMTEMKIDGLALSLIYENGKLVRGATRGNGLIGEDVTAVLEYVELPRELGVHPDLAPDGGLFAGEESAAAAVPARLEVRGEVYMPRLAFKEIVSLQEQRGDERIFANPRNAAAGALKTKMLSAQELKRKTVAEQQRYQEKLEQIKRSKLSLWAYSTPSPEVLGVQTQAGALAELEKLGFAVNPLRRVCKNYSEVIARKDELEQLRRDLSYDTDGMVIKVDDLQMQERLGEDAKSPNWAIAFKFEPEQEETRIIDIRLQVGKFGTLTPVADLEPVFVSGSTVSHATLHNLDNIRQKDIRIGDRVLIEKAGEIIPQVARSLHTARTGEEIEFEMPATCPACGSEVAQAEGKVAYYCQNISCPAQLRARLLHFVSRAAMDIEGFGPAVIDSLLERGKLHDVADIYALSFADLRELWEDTERKKLLENLSRNGKTGNTNALEGCELQELRSMWNAQLVAAGRKEYVPPEYKNAENMLAAIEASKARGLERLLAALAIEQLGETAARIIAGHFTSLARLYTADATEIAGLSAGETFSYRTLGTKAAKQLYGMLRIESARELLIKPGQTLEKKLERLNLSGFGVKKREAVAKAFAGDVTKLLAASESDLAGVELGTSDVKRTLGEVVARSLVAFLQNKANRLILERLMQAGVSTESETAGVAGTPILSGKSFVITGTLPGMGRSEAKSLIEAAGGRVASAVSKSTDYLVAGDKAGSKLSKAESLGVQIIDVKQLLVLCAGEIK